MLGKLLTALALMTASPVVAEPLIIAHRGASGERPEHTRMAYDLAIDQGADVIEPDLVMSRDGVLVVRHENEIGETTDVADRPEFADRRATRFIDGREVSGWFTEDFTLAELKSLRARERLPQLRPANTAYDRREPILTFEEVIAIARAGTERTGRTIGIAPELKHPTYFAGRGLPMQTALVAVLESHGLTGADAAVFVQCFEVGTLKTLNGMIETPLVQLIDASGGPADLPEQTYAAMITPDGLLAIREYADWVGVNTRLIEPRPGAPTALIDDAHAAGLKVAAWTFRAENAFLADADRIGDDPVTRGRMDEMVERFLRLGLDAVFADQPVIAVEAVRVMRR
ncbi:MAG: glycerophosphodiester phosphodiesterase [Brevundimonas sp.]|nr:glycerophosphodiester phosphodiesterase [Brevundimonas sp.]